MERMQALSIQVPGELPLALGKRQEDASREVLLMAALKLFETGRLSSGMAAQLAGLSRVAFLLECGHYGVSVFQQTGEELESDLRNALAASDC